jgi:hypothetical protein
VRRRLARGGATGLTLVGAISVTLVAAIRFAVGAIGLTRVGAIVLTVVGASVVCGSRDRMSGAKPWARAFFAACSHPTAHKTRGGDPGGAAADAEVLESGSVSRSDIRSRRPRGRCEA